MNPWRSILPGTTHNFLDNVNVAWRLAIVQVTLNPRKSLSVFAAGRDTVKFSYSLPDLDLCTHSKSTEAMSPVAQYLGAVRILDRRLTR